MPTYGVAILADPNDMGKDDPKTEIMVKVVADSVTAPITDVSSAGSGDFQQEMLQMIQQAMSDYADATGKNMTPAQAVRFVGHSALLTEEDQ